MNKTGKSYKVRFPILYHISGALLPMIGGERCLRDVPLRAPRREHCQGSLCQFHQGKSGRTSQNVQCLCQEYVLNEALFRVFDEDRSGTLNFFEWYQATNVKNMSTVEEKLNWIFLAFDADNGGSIDLNEIREIVIWMFRFAGIEEDPDLLASCVIDVR